MSREIKITQSLLKELFEYKSGKSCGLVFIEKFIHNNFHKFTASDTQKLGTWFEYNATGALPKDGKIPEPTRTKSGELTADFKKMEHQLGNFKRFMSFYNIKMLSTQVVWSEEGLEGTLDILCEAGSDIKDSNGNILIQKGEHFIIDIKTTGLLDDKYNEYGWNLDHLSNKHKLILQPIHYKFISRLKFDTEYKFLFLLFSTSNENDFRAILFNTREEDMEYHAEFLKNSIKWLQYYLTNGFDAKPELLRCNKCAIKLGCKHFKSVPDITIFELQDPNNS